MINSASNSGDLQPEDIFVRKFDINMGMKDKHPLEQVRFYRKDQDGNFELIQKQLNEISTMMPEKAQSSVVRLFVKDEKKFE